MKILVVDDELLVRIGIKSCAEWGEYGMEIVGEASDGIDALRQIRLCNPDVLLLDLKMPNMDGIELMQKMASEKLNCKVLVLSGFDDLYHVKEAMRLGAVDYLHKPCMSGNDILEALLKIKKLLEDEKQHGKRRAQETAEKSEYLLKEAFLKEITESPFTDEEEFKKKCDELNIKLQAGSFTCLVFSVRNLDSVRSRYKEGSLNVLQSAITNIMNSILVREDNIEFYQADKNLYVVMIGSRDVSEKRITENTAVITNTVIDAMKQFLNIEITVGISDIHKTCKGLKQAFEEALSAMSFRFYRDTAVIRFAEIRMSEDKDTLILVDALIEKMKDYLTAYDYRKFGATIENLVNFLLKTPCLTERDIKKLFNVLLFLSKQGKAGLEETEKLTNSETLVELYAAWKDMVKDKLPEDKNAARFQNCSHLVKKLSSYIEENYGKDISLKLLSEKFNISPNYISRVFREETGGTLFGYLNAVRVDKAKLLIRDTGLKIYEIGEKVGFKSTVHFNIVFNKLTGLSPKQYKDQL